MGKITLKELLCGANSDVQFMSEKAKSRRYSVNIHHIEIALRNVFFPKILPVQYDGRKFCFTWPKPSFWNRRHWGAFLFPKVPQAQRQEKPEFFFKWKKKPLSPKALGGTQPFSQSLYIKEIHIPNKPSCLSCEWNKLEYSSTSHCMENTHPLAFSVFYSLELLFCILGAQKGWRYHQGCCQLPKLQGLLWKPGLVKSNPAACGSKRPGPFLNWATSKF